MFIALVVLLIAAIIGSIIEGRTHQRLARTTIIDIEVIDDLDIDITDPYGDVETAHDAVLNWE